MWGRGGEEGILNIIIIFFFYWSRRLFYTQIKNKPPGEDVSLSLSPSLSPSLSLPLVCSSLWQND